MWVGSILALALLACALYAARQLEQRVHASAELRQAPQFSLLDAPPGLDEHIQKHLAAIQDLVWINPGVCARVAGVLAQNGWVKRVISVRKTHPPIIEVSCDYRTPAALISTVGGDFFLVDAERVRLPGQYTYHASLMKVEGVFGAPSAAGEVWAAPELAAALSIMKSISQEPFQQQIVGVRVTNYRGRVNRREPQIELLTDQLNGRIVWGSAPGEEVEENTAAQKLAILRANFDANGRADAGRPIIDVASLPSRYTSPILTDAGVTRR